jgi:hypothetical protein
MKRPRKRVRFGLCLVLANSPAMGGCLAMSSYQNARITEPGPARATIAGSVMRPSDDPEAENLYVIDVEARKGLAGASDVAWGVTLITAGEGALMAVDAEPRLAIVNGWLAVGVPLTYYVGAPLPWGLQVAPGAVATLPVSKQFEINAAAKIVLVAGGEEAVPAYNFGFGFSDDLRRWAIRPEVGLMKSYDEDEGWLVQLGVGVEPPVERVTRR